MTSSGEPERSPEQLAEDAYLRGLAEAVGLVPITEDDPHSEDGFGQGDDA